ncbi:MAG: MBL fold metallo-hydrolase [Chloroflexi bacterium]|nr:MBL fold metallo-hydrolase [Chloroflexota bacterium]
MLFQRFEAKGLAHYSYLVGDGNQAVVIDPQRDCDVYVDTAAREGLAITHILETHRNEDYVIGSVELASQTGAQVLHSAHDELDYGYGGRIAEGEVLRVGRLRLEPLHTPGHTLGHMGYLLRDPSGWPWVVFTGDALFAGDVGRCDFYGPDRLEEMAGLLYDSIFNKLLPLGDGVILAPAHGSGSACGTAIAERPWTTIGLERKHNARLQHADKASFVAHVARMLEYPPYFRMMEKLNLEGAPLLSSILPPKPLSAHEFAAEAVHARVLDTRMELAFTAAHVPGALSIWHVGVPGWAGWFVPYDKPLLLVSEGNDPWPIVRDLRRLGYDHITGFLSGGMLAWHTAGLRSESIATVTVQRLCGLLDEGMEPWILDVRSEDEVRHTPIPGAHHIHLSHVQERMSEVPQDQPVYIFCGSGLRSTVAASLLKRGGWQNLTVVLGGLEGWNSVSCPLP